MYNTTIKLHTISIPHCAQTKKQQKAFSFKYDEKIQTKKQRSSVLVPLRIIQIFSAVLLQFIEISRLQIIDIQLESCTGATFCTRNRTGFFLNARARTDPARNAPESEPDPNAYTRTRTQPNRHQSNNFKNVNKFLNLHFIQKKLHLISFINMKRNTNYLKLGKTTSKSGSICCQRHILITVKIKFPKFCVITVVTGSGPGMQSYPDPNRIFFPQPGPKPIRRILPEPRLRFRAGVGCPTGLQDSTFNQ